MEKLSRAASPELDAILGETFKVLDDGFVRVVDYMGNDSSIVQAARVSYGDGTKKGSDDGHLIRYLMRHRHTTPFEMCELKLHVRAPMDVWRQWVRHRTASVNEYSTRYSIAIDAARSLAPDEWRSQSTTNRQGSGDALPEDVGAALSADEKDFHAAARALYEKRLAAGVSREIARKDLPLATYTEAYTSSRSACRAPRSTKSASTPSSSAAKSSRAGCPRSGRRSRTTSSAPRSSPRPKRKSFAKSRPAARTEPSPRRTGSDS